MHRVRVSMLALLLTLGIAFPATVTAAQSRRGPCTAAGIGMGLALAGLFFPPTTPAATAFFIANLWIGVPAAAYGMSSCRR